MALELKMEDAYGHVQDATTFHLPAWMGFKYVEHGHAGHGIRIPQPFEHTETVMVHGKEEEHLVNPFPITKYMVIELFVAVVLVAIFVPLAMRIRKGGVPRGIIWNFFESLLVFIRNEVARPTIGRKEGDKYLPFLWTLFFFVLGCNLSGMLPWMGSPTGALACTLTLAVITFVVVTVVGMLKYGGWEYWFGLVPPLGLPWYMMIVLWPMLLVIEIVALCIKHFILAVRLLANMFAGHMVLSVILLFAVATAGESLFFHSGIAAVSLFGGVCISMLELFVGFLQAYIFVFLASLFIGMSVHQH